MDIAGSSAFVTGAGSGIGRAAAIMLAERGAAHVVVADLNGQAAEETVRLLTDRGGKGRAVRLDVTDSAALEAAIAEADAAQGLDIMFSNAGIIGGPPAFPEMSVTRIELLIAVNLTAMIMGSKFAIQRMKARGKRGAVLVTASRASLNPSWSDPVYTATKAGILMFVRSCHDLAAESGIRVNAVCPGVTDTGLLRLTGGGQEADWLLDRMKGVRIIAAEEIAEAALRLAEDESRAGEYELVDNQREPAA